MNHTNRKLNFYSLNTRGLANKIKRVTVFQWLKNKHNGIIFLQETHSTSLTEKAFAHDWDGEIFYSHGTASSRGVAILIPKGIHTHVKEIQTDKEGRILLLNITIDNTDLVLCNVYAPTKDKSQEQMDFLRHLEKYLIDYIDSNIILGGDFNTYLDHKLDKKDGTVNYKSTYSKLLRETMESYNLIDIWRTMNPSTKRYTWRGMSKRGQMHSRLDYFLISNHMIHDFHTANILPSIKSDHSIIKISFILKEEIDKGKGFWKFNTSLLKDIEYVNLINNIIDESIVKYNNLENKALAWDLTKCEIRGKTMLFVLQSQRNE